MDIQEMWAKALRYTEIIRPRVQPLMTFKDTMLPYILLSESSINVGDTVVRQGEVVVAKPSLLLPPQIPQLEGFDFEEETQVSENSVVNFFLVRGINLPSLRYNNTTHSLEVYEGSLSRAATHYKTQLQTRENVHAGLVLGPEDCWQFSLLIYSCSQIQRNVDNDIQNLLREYRKNQS